MTCFTSMSNIRKQYVFFGNCFVHEKTNYGLTVFVPKKIKVKFPNPIVSGALRIFSIWSGLMLLNGWFSAVFLLRVSRNAGQCKYCGFVEI